MIRVSLVDKLIAFKYSIYSKTDKYLKKFPQDSNTTVMLIWCLKQVKDLILKFLVNGSFC